MSDRPEPIPEAPKVETSPFIPFDPSGYRYIPERKTAQEQPQAVAESSQQTTYDPSDYKWNPPRVDQPAQFDPSGYLWVPPIGDKKV